MGKAKVTGGNQRKKGGKAQANHVRITKKDWEEERLGVPHEMELVPETNTIPFTKEEVVGKDIFVYFNSEDDDVDDKGVLDRGTIKEVDVNRRDEDPDNPRPMHRIYFHQEKKESWEDLSRCQVFWHREKKPSLLTSDQSQWCDDEGVVWPPVEEKKEEKEAVKVEETPEGEKQGRGGRGRARGKQPAVDPAAQPERQRRGRRGGDITPPNEQALAAVPQEEKKEEKEEEMAPEAEAVAAAEAAPPTAEPLPKPDAPAPRGGGAENMEVEEVDITTGLVSRPESAGAAAEPAAAAAAPVPAEPAAAPAPPPSGAPAPAAVPEKEKGPEKEAPAAEAAPAAPEKPATEPAAIAPPAAAPVPPPAVSKQAAEKPAAPAAAAPPPGEARKKKRTAGEGPLAGAAGAAAAAEAGPSKKQAVQAGAKPQQKPQDRQRQQQPKQQQQQPRQKPGVLAPAAGAPARPPPVPKTPSEKAAKLDELKKRRETLQSQLDALNREAAAIGADLLAHPVTAAQASSAGLVKNAYLFVNDAISSEKPGSLERRDSWVTAPTGDLLTVLNGWLSKGNRALLAPGPKVAAWKAAAEGGAASTAPAPAAPAPPAPKEPAPAAPPAEKEKDEEEELFPPTGDETRDNAIKVLAHSLVTATSSIDAAREMELALWAKFVTSQGEKAPTPTYISAVKRLWEGLSPRSTQCRPALRFGLLTGICNPSEMACASPEFLAKVEAAALEAMTAPKVGWLAEMLRTVQLPHRTAPPGVMVQPPVILPGALPPAGGDAALPAAPPPAAPPAGPAAAAAEDMDLGE